MAPINNLSTKCTFSSSRNKMLMTYIPNTKKQTWDHGNHHGDHHSFQIYSILNLSTFLICSDFWSKYDGSMTFV